MDKFSIVLCAVAVIILVFMFVYNYRFISQEAQKIVDMKKKLSKRRRR